MEHVNPSLMTGAAGSAFVGIIVFIFIMLFSMIKILKEHERVVVFRLGKYVGVRGPGIVFIIPVLERINQRIDLRTIPPDMSPEEVILKK